MTNENVDNCLNACLCVLKDSHLKCESLPSPNIVYLSLYQC